MSCWDIVLDATEEDSELIGFFYSRAILLVSLGISVFSILFLLRWSPFLCRSCSGSVKRFKEEITEEKLMKKMYERDRDKPMTTAKFDAVEAGLRKLTDLFDRMVDGIVKADELREVLEHDSIIWNSSSRMLMLACEARPRSKVNRDAHECVHHI